MVFKRRDRRPIWQIVFDFFYPRGGWARAFEYVKHRVRRLPDTPERISRGIWAGVFTTFTPFYGLHFLVAAIIARVMRGNILAALLGTFFGNPLTYVPIAIASLSSGHFLLGTRPHQDLGRSLSENFAAASGDLMHNIKAFFTSGNMDWHELSIFYDEVFFPYMVGGVIPGVIVATVAYYLSVPIIRVYQNRRRKILQAKLGQLKKKRQGADDLEQS